MEDHGRDIGFGGIGSPMLCSHANEVPKKCPCGPYCYCRQIGSCRGNKVQTYPDPQTLATAQAHHAKQLEKVRKFSSGATRDSDNGKLDYEAFISPRVLEAYAEFMHKNRFQKDGSVRDGDNWQKGIPKEVYAKSLIRHVMDVWLQHRGHKGKEPLKTALCAVLFNVMGYLHELLKEEDKRFEYGKDLGDETEKVDWGI